MKRICLLLLLGVISIVTRAQTAASYGFARSTGTFTSIAGGSGTVSTTTISYDDAVQTGISLGFNFTYCGSTYNTISVNSNGWLSLSNCSVGGYPSYYNYASAISGLNNGIGLLAVYWDDLNGGGHTAYYQTSGTAPNRIFTFQWGDPGNQWGNYSGGGTATFQVVLYESSNVIQYVYGAGSYGSSATIGIFNSPSDFLNMADQYATTVSSSFSNSVTGSPAANTLLTWTPPATVMTSPASLNYTTLVSTTSTAQTVNISGFGFTSSPVTITAPTSYEVYDPGTSTWVTSFTVATSSVSPTVGTYIPSTPVQVRFIAPSTVGTTTGNLAITGAGLASTVNVALTGNAVNPCTGTPTAGTVTVMPTAGGTTTPFTLTGSGYTLAAGITFQWQSSPDGTTWSNITGATNDNYSFTGISATTNYRLNVTCTNSSATVATSSVTATYLPPATCGTTSSSFYYSPATSYKMSNFSLTGYSGSTINDDGPITPASSGYEDRTTSVPAINLMQANTYSGTISYNSSYYFEDQIWIDFNNNGTFESSEIVTPVINGVFVTSSSFTLAIPAGAPTGARRMRVRTVMTYSSSLSSLMDPCNYYDPDYWNYYYYGTTRDYIANIVPQPPCTGTPVTGTISAAAAVGCGSLTTGLSLPGATNSVAGLTYQWQSSPDNSAWTNIATATNATLTVTATANTYYRVTMGCTPSSLSATSSSTMLTINPLPAVITGSSDVCISSSQTLADVTPGGTWSSSNTSMATVGASTGIVSGVAYGTANVSYTLTSTGCYRVVVMNVNSLTPTVSASASAITICEGGSTNLSAAITATLPPYDLSPIPYSFTTQTSPTTVTSFSSIDDGYASIPLPFTFNFFGTPYSSIYICTNGYVTFGTYATTWSVYTYPSSSLPPMIGWSMSDMYVASPGSVKYSTEGTAPNRKFVITFDQISPCCSFNDYYDGQIVLYETSNTIDVLVSKAISGNHTIGVQNGTLAVTPPGRNNQSYSVSPSSPEAYRFSIPAPAYTWSSSPFLASTTGNAVTASNINTPPSTTFSVTATYRGCSATGSRLITVNPNPAAITGSPQVCEGLTTSLASATTGGTWTSSTGSVATIGSATGVVSGLVAGTTNVSYTLTATGCRRTQVVTVNPLPASITGTPSACVGATTNLSDATPAGSWSSGTTSVANIDPVTGVVSGVTAGLAMITYALPTGCIRSVQSTINPLPVTSITPSSSVTICAGDGAALTANAPLPQFSILNQDFNSGLGFWTVYSPSGDPASNFAITTTPVSGATGDGTPMIESNSGFATPTETWLVSPGFSTLGYGTATVTFNQYLVSIATADANVDVDYSIDNGSTWTNIMSQVGAISSSASWSASSPDVSVSLPGGALNQANLKLRWRYNSNFGLYWDIDNIKVLAYQPAPTYVWNTIGTADGLSCSSCATATITPTSTGANAYTITTTTSAGCQSTVGATVSVNPLPAAITGASEVCVNSSITMSNTDPTGSWSSADATVSVASSTGVVTGVAAGPATITYTLPTGCRSTKSIVVDPLPANITGVQQVCEGLTTTLSNTTAGGTWSSSLSSVAPVDASGIVTGSVAGFADIYYTLTATGCRVAANVTVNPTPAAITGGMQVCEGLTTALTDADPSGTWTSGTTSVATVDPSTGIVSGLVAGASTITYQLPTTCIITAVLTVNPLPSFITGTKQVCEGLTTPLAVATSGGTWSSSAANASVDATGVVSGITAGVEIITYQLPTTCLRTVNVTVNPLPAAITGTPQVCEGLSTALSNAAIGGTWASGSTGIATVDPASGIVSGVIAGTSTITYQLPTGCINTTDVTVNPLPAAITGTRNVCEGLTTTLSNASMGGTWASSTFGVASVDASGIVSGLSAGITTITYQLPTSCIITADVTVNSLPAAIVGASQVCEGSSTALSNFSAGGNWSSSNIAAATVDASGTVYGLTAGGTTVTYTLATGCISTMDMTVNPLPAAIVGPNQVCETFTTNLTDGTPSGTWSSSNFMVASIDPSGIVSGITPGTATITYQLPTSCMRTVSMIVNPQPAAIDGAMQVCEALTTTLSNASVGGVWSSGATGTATVGSTSGVVYGVSAGKAQITYALPTGCRVSANVTVNPTPAAITGTGEVCVNSTLMLNDVDAGGTWSSSLSALASVNSSTGAVTGISMGSVAITYTLPTTCKTTAVVTVNPLPAPISGVGQACENTTALYANGSSGGVWASSTPTVADIDAVTGSINAIAAGTTLISYTLPTGCLRTRTFVVNPLPLGISGATQVCESGATTLSDPTAGGVWSSGSPSLATVNSAGLVSGVSAGVTGITYMLPTGCIASTLVTVNPTPSVISGVATTCEGQMTTLSNTLPGGIWTTATSSIAAADATTGVITGVASGITTVSYAMPTGCLASRSMVVNATPAAITGAPQVCQYGTTVMSNTTPGGVWTSSAPGLATIGLSSGMVSGLVAGTVTVSYTLLTGCAAYTNVVVNPLPSAVSGATNICNGQTTTLSTASSGGSWMSSDVTIATVTSGGIVTAIAPGNANIAYAFSTGCARNTVVTVNANPAVYNMTGGGSYCAGGSGAHLGVDGSNTGISYHLYSGGTPITAVPGATGLAVDFGLITPAGTYNVIARNAGTGCTSNMTGTATITVNAVVVPDVMVSSPDAVCDGSMTTFTSIPTNGGTTPAFAWKVNGITQPGATNATFNYAPSNGDVITSAMSSSATCPSLATVTNSKTMTVAPKVMPVASIAAEPGLVVCEGNTATFTVSSLYGGSSPVYTWLKNGALAGSGSTFAYVPVNGDHITVKMTSDYTCRLMDEVTSAPLIMATSPVYIPAITIAANPGTHIAPGANLTLTADVATGGPAPAYQWYINSVAIPSATNASFTYSMYSEGDSVTCRVTGTGVCGMSAFNSVIIHVGPSGVAATGVGIAAVQLVPNPNKGHFTVKGSLATATDEEVVLEVTNMLGQVVYRQSVTPKNGLVNEQVQLGNNLANGMYMLNLKTSGENMVFHFIIEQ